MAVEVTVLMCTQICWHLWDACDECVEQAYQAYVNETAHKAILAIVPASDDEWRKRLDEVAPLVTFLPLLQGLSDEQE